MTATNAVALDARKYRWRWWTLGILSLGVLVATMDASILNVALPSLQRELGATASELQWMVTAYVLVFGGLLLTMGSLGDKYGRVRLVQIGLLFFGAASLLAAYVDTATQLIAVRAMMGVGAAMIMPATLSIIVDVFKNEERTKAIAVWAALAAVGIVVGPVFGGLLLEHFYWGSVFLVNVPFAALAIAGGLIVLPESRDPEAKPLDILGAVLSMGVVSSLVYGIIEGPNNGWTSFAVVFSLSIAFVMGLLFLVLETRSRFPLLDLSFFKRRRFSVGVTAISLTALALAGLMFGLTQYLQFVKGYTPLEAGIRFLPLAAGLMIGARISERLVHMFGSGKVIAGALVLLAGTLPLMLVWEAGSAYWLIASVMTAMGLGLGSVMAPATDALMGDIPEEKAGVGSATNGVIRMVGASLGVATIGSLMYSVYADRIAPAVGALPPELAETAKDSVGAAVMIADSLPGEAGAALFAAAGSSFSDALGVVGLVSAGVTLFTALLVARFMPAGNGNETEDSPMK